MARHSSLGFTFIELVVALALAGVLASIAFSAWKTHTIRSQVAEGVRQAHAFTESIASAFHRNGEVPANRHAAGLADMGHAGHGRYVGSVTVVNGRIDIAYGDGAHEAIQGRVLSLTPYETPNHDVVWICGNAIPTPGLQPLGFWGGGAQAVQIATTVEARFLPRDCR